MFFNTSMPASVTFALCRFRRRSFVSPDEVRQAGIGHVDVGEIELDEVRQTGQILDAGIGNRRAAQIQRAAASSCPSGSPCRCR